MTRSDLKKDLPKYVNGLRRSEEAQIFFAHERRNQSVNGLERLTKLYEEEIAAEEAKKNPDQKFIAARRAKIFEIRQTVERARNFDDKIRQR